MYNETKETYSHLSLSYRNDTFNLASYGWINWWKTMTTIQNTGYGDIANAEYTLYDFGLSQTKDD